MKTGRVWLFELVIAALGGCVLIFIVAPLLKMILSTSITDLSAAAYDKQVTDSIVLTLKCAFFATIISAAGGIPLAYLFARKRFFGRSLLIAIVDLPVIIPHCAAGVALFAVIGRNSAIGRMLGGGLIGTPAGISVAMAFVSMPFLVNAARQAFSAVPVRLEKAAKTLGASPGRVFFTISLPLGWRGILSGMVLMWARGISEFGAVAIIAYHPMTTPVLIFQRFNDFGLSYAAPATVLLILICIAIFTTLRIFSAKLQAKESDRA